MKFETKMTKLGIDENEIKSIIGNCFCGEINGAYFIDLSTMRKWEIMEVIGNYLDTDLYSEGEFYTGNKRMSTFCKTFEISEDEIADYYSLALNEGGEDIAYTLESNKDVILVLTDDERYNNSFIKYSPSQQTEETKEEDNTMENEYTELFNLIKQAEKELHTNNDYDIRENTKDGKGYIVDLNIIDNLILYHSLVKGEVISDKEESCKIIKEHTGIINDIVIERISNDVDMGFVEMEFSKRFHKEEESFSSSSQSIEELTVEYDAKIDELTQLDDETDVNEICTDRELMNEYESRKEQIEEEISLLEERIEKAQEMEESQMEEEYVSFKLESKDDSRIYLAGEVDITTIDDTDGGDWEYEQNNGMHENHIPTYWKVDGEDLTDEFHDLLNSIDWENFRQALTDFAEENRTFEYGDYYLHINEGASVEIEVIKYADFDDTYKGTIMFRYNGELIIFDNDIIRYLGSDISFNGFRVTSYSSIALFLPREFADYPSADTEEMVSNILEITCKYYAEQLTRDAGIMPSFNEIVEQEVEDIIQSDKEAMWKFKIATKNDTIEDFLKEYDFEIDD